MNEKMIKNRRHKAVALFAGLLSLFCLFSCDQREPYFQYNELKEAAWKQHDTLFFTIDSASYEVGIPYNLYLEVTNNVNYPYQNIWFFTWDNVVNDSVYEHREKEYSLADEFGKWNGEGFGSLYQSTFMYKDHVVFVKNRDVQIKILHGMRDEELSGIEKIGIRLSYKR